MHCVTKITILGYFAVTLVNAVSAQPIAPAWTPTNGLNESEVELTQVALGLLSPDEKTVDIYLPLYKQEFGPLRHTEYFANGSGKVRGSSLYINNWFCTPVAFSKNAINIDASQFFDIDGKPLDPSETKTRLRKSKFVLVSQSENPFAIDAYYKTVLAKDLIQVTTAKKVGVQSGETPTSAINGFDKWSIEAVRAPKAFPRVHLKNVSVARIVSTPNEATLDIMVPQYINHLNGSYYFIPTEVSMSNEVVGSDGEKSLKVEKTMRLETGTKDTFRLEPRDFVRFTIPIGDIIKGRYKFPRVAFKTIAGKGIDNKTIADRLAKPSHILFFNRESGALLLDPFYSGIFSDDCIVAEVSEASRYAVSVKPIATTNR